MQMSMTADLIRQIKTFIEENREVLKEIAVDYAVALSAFAVALYAVAEKNIVVAIAAFIAFAVYAFWQADKWDSQHPESC